MADENRTPSHSLTLTEQLRETPYAFDFFQAIRRLDSCYSDKPQTGHSTRAVDDPVRFGQEASMAFAPATIHSLEQENERPPRLIQRFLGLLGPQGPLPLHLTEYVRDRLRNHDDYTVLRFLDVFHHRLIGLFYRAWARVRPTVSFDDAKCDRFSEYVNSLFGLGMRSLKNRDAFPDLPKRHFAGLMSCQTKHADGLLAILSGYFCLPVEIEEFVGQWVELPGNCRCRLGSSSAKLGVDTIVGSHVWDCQQKFRVVLGPLTLEEYYRMLPGESEMSLEYDQLDGMPPVGEDSGYEPAPEEELQPVDHAFAGLTRQSPVHASVVGTFGSQAASGAPSSPGERAPDEHWADSFGSETFGDAFPQDNGEDTDQRDGLDDESQPSESITDEQSRGLRYVGSNDMEQSLPDAGETRDELRDDSPDMVDAAGKARRLQAPASVGPAGARKNVSPNTAGRASQRGFPHEAGVGASSGDTASSIGPNASGTPRHPGSSEGPARQGTPSGRTPPRGVSLDRMIAAVRSYAGDEWQWDLQLVLRKTETPPLGLGIVGNLGWSSWVIRDHMPEDPRDLVLEPMQESSSGQRIEFRYVRNWNHSTLGQTRDGHYIMATIDAADLVAAQAHG